MRVLLVTLSNINSIYENGIYQDLVREFISNGHHVDIMCPTERKHKKKTYKIYHPNPPQEGSRLDSRSRLSCLQDISSMNLTHTQGTTF